MSSAQNPIDIYISSFPKDVQQQLKKLKAIIKKVAAEAEETISYAMPTFKLYGNLVHFAGYKNHIGFYPAPSGIKAFQKELSVYKTSKGAIQLPISGSLPEGLIQEIVRYRINENRSKHESKSKQKTCPKGHQFTKSSDCPVCPICEQSKKMEEGIFAQVSAPARRALETKGITTLKQLSKYTEHEIASLHGMGPSTMKKLITKMTENALSFKKTKPKTK